MHLWTVVSDGRSTKSQPQCLSPAADLKNIGNTLFKSQDLVKASEKYKKALRYAEFATNRPGISEEEIREFQKSCVVPVHSNLAQVEKKSGED